MELRLGDASANPYLAIAALLAAAYIGIQEELDPTGPARGLRLRPGQGRLLPADLSAALTALEADAELIEVLGRSSSAPSWPYKRNELERFAQSSPTGSSAEYTYHL